MKRTRTARIFAAVLAAIMAFALLPASAFADNEIKEIAAAKTLGGSVSVRGVVTCAYGGGLFIQDSTDAVFVRCASLPTGITRGTTVTASGICGTYAGETCIENAAVTVGSGLYLSAENTTVSALSAFNNGRYVKISGLEVVSVKGANILLKDSGDNFVTLNNSALYSLAPGQKADVCGAVVSEGSGKYLMNSSTAEVTLINSSTGEQTGFGGSTGEQNGQQYGSTGNKVAEVLTAVSGGESIVIFNSNGLATAGSRSYDEGEKSGFAPVSAGIADDMVFYGEGTAIFTVTALGEGRYSLTSGGKLLSMTVNGVQLISGADTTTAFTLESVEGGFRIVSTMSDSLYLEYRAGYFTVSDGTQTGSSVFKLCKVDAPEPTAPEAPTADIEPGEVAKNTVLSFSAEDGAKIYYKACSYTVDDYGVRSCTVPEEFTEYTKPLRINQDTAYIVCAIKAGLRSEDAVFDYTVKPAYAVVGGSYVIFYEASSEIGYSVGGTKDDCMNAVATVVTDGVADTENGALLFTVDNDGVYTWFVSGGRYLAAGENEGLTLSDELNDYALWTLTEKNGSYVVTNKAARYDEEEVCIEYHNSSFFVSNYDESASALFEMDFFPVDEDTTIIDGVVSAPCVRISGKDIRHITEDYEGSFVIDDVAGEPASVALSYKSSTGEAEAVTFTDNGSGRYSFTVPTDKLDGIGEEFTLEVIVINEAGQRYVARKTVSNIDKPYVVSVSPEDGALTGDNKRPEIQIKIKNMGDKPLVSLYVNGERIEFPKYGYDTEEEGTVGVIRYQSESPFSDGRVSVRLCVQRIDGEQTTDSFSFTVGSNPNLHFYGQLNGHTELSGGEGTIKDAIDYVDGLDRSSGVDFISVTDSAAAFDKGANANEADALNSAGAASIESRKAWSDYNSAADTYNYNQNDRIVLTGFDLRWTDGSSITTYNSAGVVSARNSKLGVTGGYSGLNEYYKLLEDSASADTVSQFNAGSFNSFDYYSEAVDSRIALIQVGSESGRIDTAGYDSYILALDRGWHLSPVISQNNMNGMWGNSNESRDVIITTSFTESGLYRAMKANSVYTTEDRNLEVNFVATVDRTDYPMGSVADAEGKDVRLRIDASDPDSTDRIVKLELIGNNGAVIKTWNDPQGEVSETVEGGKYSYYLVRVTEQDGDVALTSPIWTEKTVRLGIASMECTTAYPVTDEELKILFTPFTEETGETEIRRITLKVDGEAVKEMRDIRSMTSQSHYSLNFTYTPTKAKETTIELETLMVYDGKEYIRTKSMTIDVADSDKLTYIGIDRSHNNDLDETDSTAFAKLALQQNMRLVFLETSEELIEALANPKYTVMVFTAPVNEENGVSQEDNKYLEEELNAVKSFSDNGGAVIVTGISDAEDVSGKSQSSAMQNALLDAIKSDLRLSDNTVTDVYHNGGENTELYLSSYNFDSFLTKGIVTDSSHLNDYSKDGANTQFYSQVGGSSVYEVDAGEITLDRLSGDVTPVVYALTSARALDKDSDGMEDARYKYNSQDSYLVMATEKVSGKGLVLVAGGSFMDNNSLREADAGKKRLSNTDIVKNLLKELNPDEITDIAAVDRQTNGGYKYTVEGVVTSNSYTYDSETGFVDCIYIQDSTGGIRCTGVKGSYKLGDKLRISGTNARVNGEATLKANNVELISSGNEVQPKTIKATEGFANTGTLVSYEGYITDVISNNDGLVTDIIAKDSTGKSIHIEIDENITPSKKMQSVKVGASVSVTGIESFDNTYNYDNGGPFERIRVRDRDDVECSVHEHSYNWEDTVKATCTVDGYRTGTCNCGSTKIEEIKATGHNWSEWVTTRKATAYTSGTKQRVCSKCNAVEFQKIPATRSPKTGDGDMILVWMLFADVALAAGTSFAVYAKKRRNRAL